jgi:hypothetical protein
MLWRALCGGVAEACGHGRGHVRQAGHGNARRGLAGHWQAGHEKHSGGVQGAGRQDMARTAWSCRTGACWAWIAGPWDEVQHMLTANSN